jgi:6-phosphogluconolactonase
MSPVDLRVLPEPESLAAAAASEIASRLAGAVGERGRASWALAGGSTPRRAYELLARDHAALPWDRIHVFWGDERCVPPDHADSNFAMARRALLDRVAIPPANVHRVRGELAAEGAALDYERELRGFFGDVAFAAFDVVLLGVGEDGHTASLFPGHPALAETTRWAVPVETAAKPPRWRVSLTLPVLCAARDVFVLAAGAGKRAVVAAVRTDADSAARAYPAAAVRPAGRLVWLVDDAAAASGGE